MRKGTPALVCFLRKEPLPLHPVSQVPSTSDVPIPSPPPLSGIPTPPPPVRLAFLLLQAAGAVEPLLCTHSWEPGRQMCRCARSRERGRLLRGTVAHAENQAERSGRKTEGDGGVEGLNEGAQTGVKGAEWDGRRRGLTWHEPQCSAFPRSDLPGCVPRFHPRLARFHTPECLSSLTSHHHPAGNQRSPIPRKQKPRPREVECGPKSHLGLGNGSVAGFPGSPSPGQRPCPTTPREPGSGGREGSRPLTHPGSRPPSRPAAHAGGRRGPRRKRSPAATPAPSSSRFVGLRPSGSCRRSEPAAPPRPAEVGGDAPPTWAEPLFISGRGALAGAI